MPRTQLSSHVPVTAADIVGFARLGAAGVGEEEVRQEDVIVHNLEINYGMGDKNPIDYCHFFKDWRSFEKFHIPAEKVRQSD